MQTRVHTQICCARCNMHARLRVAKGTSNEPFRRQIVLGPSRAVTVRVSPSMQQAMVEAVEAQICAIPIKTLAPCVWCGLLVPPVDGDATICVKCSVWFSLSVDGQDFDEVDGREPICTNDFGDSMYSPRVSEAPSRDVREEEEDETRQSEEPRAETGGTVGEGAENRILERCLPPRVMYDKLIALWPLRRQPAPIENELWLTLRKHPLLSRCWVADASCNLCK